MRSALAAMSISTHLGLFLIAAPCSGVSRYCDRITTHGRESVRQSQSQGITVSEYQVEGITPHCINPSTPIALPTPPHNRFTPTHSNTRHRHYARPLTMSAILRSALAAMSTSRHLGLSLTAAAHTGVQPSCGHIIRHTGVSQSVTSHCLPPKGMLLYVVVYCGTAA